MLGCFAVNSQVITSAGIDTLVERTLASCVKFDQTNHLLDRIAASPVVTVSDMEIFNIKKGILLKTTRTRPQTTLTEPLFAAIQPIGGGTVSIKCRDASGGRAAIIAGADAV